MLREFFEKSPEDKQSAVAPGANGQTGYTGLLVETAASSDKPDWKEMLNWSTPIPSGHPLKRTFPTAYPDQVLPERAVPGITDVLYRFHDTVADLQRRFLRVIAEGIGCHETFFDEMVQDGPTLTRAIRYPAMSELDTARGADGEPGHVWAAEHGDINLITALPRATAPGLQVKVNDEWVDAVPPDDGVIVNTGIMLERLTNGRIPIGWHRVVAAPGFDGERYSVVQFCHPRPWTVLSPVPSCCTPETPQRFSAISAADALDEVLYEINLVEGARRLD
jgi:isopenicillin N synthase-like dioxygenase